MKTRQRSTIEAENLGIARAYIRYQTGVGSGSHTKDFDMVMQLNEYAVTDPIRTIQIMDAIVERTDVDKVFGIMGAGPMENLLSQPNVGKYADDIIERARQNAHWRLALGCVWTSGFADKELASRVEQAIAKFYPKGRP